MLFRCLLLGVLSLVNANLEVHQEFATSQRVSLRFEIGTDSFDDQLPRVFNLFPHAPKTNLLLLDSFTPVFNFSIQLISPFTREPLGDKIHRRVQLTPNQPWFNDTFTTASGVSLSVATRISCAPHFFGARCEQFCDEKLAKSGRKRCDLMGRLRCDVGWMGPHCSQVVDPRKCNCQNHGVCVSSLILNSTTLAQEHLICECASGFTGEKCEVPAFTQFEFNAPKSDACSAKDACLNGAQCFPNGPKVFCACLAGFVGEFCEVNLSTQAPIIEITAKTSGYSYTVYSMAGIFILLILGAACFTYRMKPSRENALTRGQAPCPFAMPENKSKLVDATMVKKVFSIEDVKIADDEEIRYTVAPRKSVSNEYATIQKASSTPPPPNVFPPPIPHYV